ncbi:hypothetical protein M408DRAFT_327000 [Serendipita vermifera MAFF 305830]|uniref:Uncharacterized protein n=1 Tax=Serendipita vermifera MAFF 305830 TaxID=933852 RepID=A0A0C2X2D5_SERVB|nr:hypothetical protein M408DRAFT_327000 [Serendipita vermifera MAFF 305830]
MSVEVETHDLPLPLVARLFHSLQRRLGLVGHSQQQDHDQTPGQSPTTSRRPRNRLRRSRLPPPSTDRPPNGHTKEPNQRLRSFSIRTRNGGTIFTPPWKRPRPPVQPFTLHLPDDVLRTIFELAAEDLDTACSLVLVAFHVRTWVDPILYSTVRLEGLDAIRLFARTIHDSISGEYASNGETNDRGVHPLTRIAKPPDFFGCVRSLALLPHEERVLLFFRDTVRDANLILHSCHGVIELEASGDFLRRTDVSGGTVETPNAGTGDADSSGGSIDPVIATPNPIVTPQGSNERALMRPTHLTLVPPTLNVSFRLPILSNVTHLHYSSSLPRNLNFLGILLALTHLALDYQVGVATVRTDGLLQLVRTALEWGNLILPPEEEHSSEDAEPEASSSAPGQADDPEEEQQAAIPRPAPRLTMLVVRVLLRPRMEDSDRAGEAWRKLANLAQTESRLVYFESQGLFGEDVWNAAKERLSISWYRDSIS